MKKLLTLVSLSALITSHAYALDLGHDATLKGFGTLGIVNSSTGNADFTANDFSQPKGAGRTESLSLNPDSRLGLQVDWQATQKLSITSQAVSKQGPDNSWIPDLQLAFAKYKLLSNLDIRAGRIRPALFMMSDYLDMYYANPWIRPPTELYNMAPIANHMEGVDFLYRPETGPVSWLIQPFYGYSQLPISRNRTVTENDILGINISANIDDFTLRGGYTHFLMTWADPNYNNKALPILSQLSAVDPAVLAQTSNLSLTNRDLNIASLGANWDNGNYFVMGELGKKWSTNSTVLDQYSGYFSLGAHLDKFTPYFSFSATKTTNPTSFTGGTGPYAPISNEVLTEILSNFYLNQNTKTLGVRYDFYKNLDLKVQWDRIDTNTQNGQAGTGGGLLNNQTNDFANKNQAIDLFSVACDFIF